MVDDDPSLFTPLLLRSPNLLILYTGIRILYLPPSFKGFRELVRLGILSSWMFLALPYTYRRQGPAYHYLEPYHRRVRRRQRRHAAQEELILSWRRSFPNDAPPEALPHVQDKVHPRRGRAYHGSRILACFVLAASAVDQFDDSQLVRARGVA